MATRHLGGGAGLIDEDQALGIEFELPVEPGLATCQNIRPILLVRVRCLFLSVMSRRSKKRHSDEELTWIPFSANALHNSARVMSGCCATLFRITSAWASTRPDRRSPPKGPGRRCPCLRPKARHRIALAALTPNRAAA